MTPEQRKTLREIAEMAFNLAPEEVDMRYFHSPICKSKHCILGHAELRGVGNICSSNREYYAENYPGFFSSYVGKSTQQIASEILDYLGVEHNREWKEND